MDQICSEHSFRVEDFRRNSGRYGSYMAGSELLYGLLSIHGGQTTGQFASEIFLGHGGGVTCRIQECPEGL
jgi:hypothetical protein